MILSFHPCFVADRNIICAGRNPDRSDLSAIRCADAVILPQGCTEPLYRMASENCPRIFPDYGARFDYPGKTGQIRLFRSLGAAHPGTLVFADTEEFARRYPDGWDRPPMDFPMVFKFNWGGEGDSVFLLENRASLRTLLDRAGRGGNAGRTGFLIQEYIPNGNRTLRVAVIGRSRISYWRIQDDPKRFHACAARGGRIDGKLDLHLQEAAGTMVKNFCRKARIHLAGFDLLFRAGEKEPVPLLLEINWFFGRRGLGGSEAYYSRLTHEISRWLEEKDS